MDGQEYADAAEQPLEDTRNQTQLQAPTRPTRMSKGPEAVPEKNRVWPSNGRFPWHRQANPGSASGFAPSSLPALCTGARVRQLSRASRGIHRMPWPLKGPLSGIRRGGRLVQTPALEPLTSFDKGIG